MVAYLWRQHRQSTFRAQFTTFTPTASTGEQKSCGPATHAGEPSDVVVEVKTGRCYEALHDGGDEHVEIVVAQAVRLSGSKLSAIRSTSVSEGLNKIQNGNIAHREPITKCSVNGLSSAAGGPQKEAKLCLERRASIQRLYFDKIWSDKLFRPCQDSKLVIFLGTLRLRCSCVRTAMPGKIELRRRVSISSATISQENSSRMCFGKLWDDKWIVIDGSERCKRRGWWNNMWSVEELVVVKWNVVEIVESNREETECQRHTKGSVDISRQIGPFGHWQQAALLLKNSRHRFVLEDFLEVLEMP
ncbi:hypothetical protein B0H14DRAFT_2613577 [Mycena olivaceomarginata]|nr:hypothetical protein B0H14DRAFT_2613577 [Mycena olivaceomarginata]